MATAELEGVLRNLNHRTEPIEQILPTLPGNSDNGREAGPPDDVLGSLRHDIRRLAEDLAAIDRRDATQHGGMKGELAHVIRRIARLEAMPSLRRAR